MSVRSAALRSQPARRVREAAKSVLSHPIACRVGRWWQRHKCLILSFHNILPRGERAEGERSLHLPEDTFAEQLDILADIYDVVPLDAFREDMPAALRGRVALTFDDAYSGMLTAGIEQLVQRSMPATVFVPPGLLGTNAFWWDAYADPETGELPDSFRGEVLRAGARPADVERIAMRHGLTPHEVGPALRPGTITQLTSAVAADGITLGSHTWSHVALPAIHEDEVDRELMQPMRWLNEHFEHTVPWISYPYAVSSNVTELRSAAAGYQAGVLGAGGWELPEIARKTPFAVPRLDIAAGTDGAAFRRWLAGFGGR